MRKAILFLILAGCSAGAGFLVVNARNETASTRRVPGVRVAHSSGATAIIETSPPPRFPSTMSLAEFRAFAERPGSLVLDARPDVYYQGGHVPGALSLPAVRFQAGYVKLKSRLETDLKQPMVLYCEGRDCGAAEQVRALLAAKGFVNVSVFSDGWLAWQEAGLPAEKSDGAHLPLPAWKGAK